MQLHTLHCDEYLKSSHSSPNGPCISGGCDVHIDRSHRGSSTTDPVADLLYALCIAANCIVKDIAPHYTSRAACNDGLPLVIHPLQWCDILVQLGLGMTVSASTVALAWVYYCVASFRGVSRSDVIKHEWQVHDKHSAYAVACLQLALKINEASRKDALNTCRRTMLYLTGTSASIVWYELRSILLLEHRLHRHI